MARLPVVKLIPVCATRGDGEGEAAAGEARAEPADVARRGSEAGRSTNRVSESQTVTYAESERDSRRRAFAGNIYTCGGRKPGGSAFCSTCFGM